MNGIEDLKLMMESRSTDYGKMRQILSMYILNSDKLVSDLRAKLKVAEDTLKEMLDFQCLNCPKLSDSGCKCAWSPKIHKWRSAIAAIREEGGAR